MPSRLVTAKDVTKTFGNTTALRDVSFSIPSGLSMLLGPNGSGKTTFLRTASGLLLPDNGKVEVFGHDPYKEYSQIKDRVSFALQEPHVPETMKVKDFLEAIKVEKEASSYTRAVRAFEIEGILEKKFKELSGGFKKRVSLAQSFIGKPELMVVDEPFANLDIEAKLHISNLMNKLVENGQVSLLVITHNIGGLKADHLTILYAGEVVISKKYDDLIIDDIESFILEKDNGEKVEISSQEKVRDLMKEGGKIKDVKKLNFERFLKEKFREERNSN